MLQDSFGDEGEEGKQRTKDVEWGRKAEEHEWGRKDKVADKEKGVVEKVERRGGWEGG